MDQESMSKLRLDKRLATRRGWLSEGELAEELANLPDASHKIADTADDPAEEAGEPEAPPA